MAKTRFLRISIAPQAERNDLTLEPSPQMHLAIFVSLDAHDPSTVGVSQKVAKR
jgi:hypothetical protein